MGKQERRLLITFFIIFYFIILLRNAWICDDAYISFRVIDNFINGFGLRWNVIERVQAYTHPLWVFLLIPFYALIGDMYFTALLISVILSVGAVSIYGFKLANSTMSACVGILILSLSDAFIDYSTSGLENPLTFFIIAVFLYIYFKKPDGLKKIFYLSLWASLGAVNRLDTILVFLPILAYSFWQIRDFRAVKAMLIGFLPLAIWELFSLFYYGFPFPNTAYAKLSTGLGSSYLIPRGLAYLHCSLIFDPLTIIVLIFSIVVPLALSKHRLLPIVAAILLYLLYVINIGGCFMYGRHLSTPFFMAVIALGYIPIPVSGRYIVIGLAGIILLMGVTTARSPFKYSPHVQDMQHEGIADERSYYNRTCGFGNYNFDNENWPKHLKVWEGKQLRDAKESFYVSGCVGMLGFFGGPDLFILDYYALTDPLLARLPASGSETRIGHFRRDIPRGYAETIKSGANEIWNKNLAEYYDKLIDITKGPLFNLQRFSEIIKINLGQYDNLLEAYLSPHLMVLSLNKISTPAREATKLINEKLVSIYSQGLEVTLPNTFYYTTLEFGRDHSHDYEATFYLEGSKTGSIVIPRNITRRGGITISKIEIEPKIYEAGYDKIKFIPTAGDGMYSIGHVIFPDRQADSTKNLSPAL